MESIVPCRDVLTDLRQGQAPENCMEIKKLDEEGAFFVALDPPLALFIWGCRQNWKEKKDSDLPDVLSGFLCELLFSE